MAASGSGSGSPLRPSGKGASSNADAVAALGFKPLRTRKACQLCRLRKVKCDGEQPCRGCRVHNSVCQYGPGGSPGGDVPLAGVGGGSPSTPTPNPGIIYGQFPQTSGGFGRFFPDELGVGPNTSLDGGAKGKGREGDENGRPTKRARGSMDPSGRSSASQHLDLLSAAAVDHHRVKHQALSSSAPGPANYQNVAFTFPGPAFAHMQGHEEASPGFGASEQSSAQHPHLAPGATTITEDEMRASALSRSFQRFSRRPPASLTDGIRSWNVKTNSMQYYGSLSIFNLQQRLIQVIQALRLRERFASNGDQAVSSTAPSGVKSAEQSAASSAEGTGEQPQGHESRTSAIDPTLSAQQSSRQASEAAYSGGDGAATPGMIDPATGRPSRVPEAFSEYGYQRLLFRWEPGEAGVPSRKSAILGDLSGLGAPLFLPLELVHRLEDNYFRFVHPLFPILERGDVRKWIDSMWTMGLVPPRPVAGKSGELSSVAAGPHRLRNNEAALMFMVLCLGAFLDDGEPMSTWKASRGFPGANVADSTTQLIDQTYMNKETMEACADQLCAMAKTKLEDIIEDSSVRSVQCLLLMSFYLIEWSKPNVAYLYFGQAARMAISLGLHRESSYACMTPADSVRLRLLWWSCYQAEKRFSYWFSRTSAIREEEIDCALPERPEASDHLADNFLRGLSQTIRLASDLLKIVNNPPPSPGMLLEMMHGLDAQMVDICQSLPEVLRWGLECELGKEQVVKGQEDETMALWRFELNTVWWHIRLLFYRPFVLLALYCCASKQVFPPEASPAIEKGGHIARRLIYVIDSLTARHPPLRNFKFTTFYLHSACSTLLADILCDPRAQQKAFGHFAAIDRAVKWLESSSKKYFDVGTTSTLKMARDVMALAKNVVQAASDQRRARGPKAAVEKPRQNGERAGNNILAPLSAAKNAASGVNRTRLSNVTASPVSENNSSPGNFEAELAASFDWLAQNAGSEGQSSSPHALDSLVYDPSLFSLNMSGVRLGPQASTTPGAAQQAQTGVTGAQVNRETGQSGVPAVQEMPFPGAVTAPAGQAAVAGVDVDVTNGRQPGVDMAWMMDGVSVLDWPWGAA